MHTAIPNGFVTKKYYVIELVGSRTASRIFGCLHHAHNYAKQHVKDYKDLIILETQEAFVRLMLTYGAGYAACYTDDQVSECGELIKQDIGNPICAEDDIKINAYESIERTNYTPIYRYSQWRNDSPEFNEIPEDSYMIINATKIDYESYMLPDHYTPTIVHEGIQSARLEVRRLLNGDKNAIFEVCRIVRHYSTFKSTASIPVIFIEK